MIKEQMQETGKQLKHDLKQAKVTLPVYVKKASQDILKNMQDKEKQAHPQMDGSFLSSVHYFTVAYFKSIGKFLFYLLAYLAFCQILFPQASLVFAVSGILSLAILSSSAGLFKALMSRIFSPVQVQETKEAEARQEKQG